MAVTQRDPGAAGELRVEVRLLGQYAELVGSRRVALAVPRGATIGVALRMLEAEASRGASCCPATGAAGMAGAVVFVNGRNVAHDGGLDRVLADGDTIVVTTPIGGG